MRKCATAWVINSDYPTQFKSIGNWNENKETALKNGQQIKIAKSFQMEVVNFQDKQSSFKFSRKCEI